MKFFLPATPPYTIILFYLIFCISVLYLLFSIRKIPLWQSILFISCYIVVLFPAIFLGPIKYEITNSSINIYSILYKKVIHMSEILNIYRTYTKDPSVYKWNLRNIEYIKGKEYHYYVTNKNKLVVIETNKKNYIISPNVPERFITLLKQQLIINNIEIPISNQILLPRPSWGYKTKITIWGLPLFHICGGWDSQNDKPMTARGIIAIGPFCRGIINIGCICIGIINIAALGIGILSLGCISFGVISCGVLSIGLLFSLGGGAIGAATIGGVAIGIIAIGGVCIGYYTMGYRCFGKYVIDTTTRSQKAIDFFIRK